MNQNSGEQSFRPGKGALLVGGGEMGERIRSLDWSKTLVGPLAEWPQSLSVAVRIILNSRFPMFVWWGHRLLNIYNDAYIPMLGKRHPNALGRAAAEIWPDIWPVIGPQAEMVLNEGRATWNEEKLLVMERNDFTEEAYFTFSYSPMHNEDGNVGGVFCAVTEDTTRVLSQRRLRTLRELAAQTTDETRSPETACQIAADILGRNQHDVPFALLYLLDSSGELAMLAGSTGLTRGMPASPAAVDLGQAEGPWPFRRVAETGQPVEVHDLLSKFEPFASGVWPESPRQAMVLPMAKPGQAQLAGFVVAGVSPRRPLDGNYRDFYDLVAGQIATAVASARAYEEEKRRAEALVDLDRAKTQFFSNVSHEFRTPLTLMLGPLEDVLGGGHAALPASTRGQLEIVQRNSLRMLKLVNTMLDFSRIESGRMQARYQPTDVAAYTAELASNFRSACERAGLKLKVDCAPLPSELPSAYVDRDMWEKIVLNLLSNAYKYTLEGEIAVSLVAVDGKAVLSVRDTGVGIPAAELPRIFERFHRVRDSRGRTHEGTGIGLALVQELVQLQNGTVQVESELGKGSRFVVTIPLGSTDIDPENLLREPEPVSSRPRPYVADGRHRDADQATPASLEDPARGGPADGRSQGDRGRFRILWADDNADMRDYVTNLLSSAGFAVEAVSDGRAALNAARARPPDLVLSDIMMPNLDGFGLLDGIRAEPELREIPVVLLSARAGEESRIDGVRAGADDYLIKPFSARELLARVEAHARMSRFRRRAAERLGQSAKMEAVGRLAGGLAHDFNNQLHAIHGFAEFVARDEGLSARARLDLAEIRKVADRMASLTRQLLAYSRQQLLSPETLDLNDAVRDCQAMLQRLIGSDIRIVLRLSQQPIWVHLDGGQLVQVLMNLVINARDAMSQGGEILLETTSGAVSPGDLDEFAGPGGETGQYARLRITDSGDGIASDDLPHLFEPFYTTKEVGRGTGLGLATVQGIVVQSRGYVWAENVPSGGARFTVLLPLTGEPAPAPSPGPAPSECSARQGRLLVVEDEDMLLHLLVRRLEEEGYELLQARNGEEALRRLQDADGPVDLVISDVVMPVMGGAELGARLAEMHPDLAVIWMSGYPRGDSDAYREGHPFLQKPITSELLVETVRQVLESRVAHPESA